MNGTDPTIAYIALGSNMGRRLDNLRGGVSGLAADPRIRPGAFSSVWESEYVGPGRQDPYLNAVLAVATELPPAVLLSVCKQLEIRLGREAEGHLKPRPLDLDLLLWGDHCQADAHPVLPHPRLAERGFVLAPLAELIGSLVLPDSQETVKGAYEKIRAKREPWLRRRPDMSLKPAVTGREANGSGPVALYRR